MLEAPGSPTRSVLTRWGGAARMGSTDPITPRTPPPQSSLIPAKPLPELRPRHRDVPAQSTNPDSAGTVARKPPSPPDQARTSHTSDTLHPARPRSTETPSPPVAQRFPTPGLSEFPLAPTPAF